MDTRRLDTEQRYVVDAFSASTLARDFDAFSAVEIRELLEGERVPDAMKMLAHYSGKADPYQELKAFSVSSGLGFYRDREKRRSVEQDYEHYLHFLAVKDSEHYARTGHWLTTAERDELTRCFYEPAYRAEMAKLAAQTHRQLYKDRVSNRHPDRDAA